MNPGVLDPPLVPYAAAPWSSSRIGRVPALAQFLLHHRLERRQVSFDHVPDTLQVDIRIPVGDTVAEVDNGAPGNL
ncbi:MAG: hypothetical protein M3Z66_22795 [Chloroflexota bacterium]|nr:hypothetical protein [Chloroflexota bacterium]